MIIGRVRGGVDAVIPITVRSRLNASLAVAAVVDTGFDGFLTAFVCRFVACLAPNG